MRTFDVVVVGAGPAGEIAAGKLADAGLEVAIVEDRLVGGECSFWACMPSKGLLRPYEALAETRRIPGAAEAVTGELDVPAVLRRRDEIIHDLDDSVQLPWLEDRGIALLRGRGRYAGDKRVTVALNDGGSEELEARRAVFLAAGTVPAMPPIEGLDEIDDAWTNRDATTAKAIPDSIVILGGGVVGVEMSQAYGSLGAKVALVEGERKLLPREEWFACEQVQESLETLGVDVRRGQKAERVSREGGRPTVHLGDGSSVSGDVLLVALGRTPQTGPLGLEELGFEPGRYVETDEHYRVPGHDGLYAIGDVNGKALFTHMGKYQARVAAAHVLGKDIAVEHGADGPLSPRVVFCDPQVAAVGHTSETAEEAGLDVEIVDVETSGNAGGSYYGRNAPGTSRLVIDRERGVLIGATITGAEVADFLHAATIAIVGEVPVARLRHAVPAFPTRSEIWLNLLEKAETGR
ncbi:MAG TPA: NAD(P)/FAD-dependent oxidoreductase [Solirubrobacteraceae bacterium]|nr:NAD(P)/FAD-dependent oxidoreductase [Solirubrobacteraceae bacterium]